MLSAFVMNICDVMIRAQLFQSVTKWDQLSTLEQVMASMGSPEFQMALQRHSDGRSGPHFVS
jgi:hypothetical protein